MAIPGTKGRKTQKGDRDPIVEVRRHQVAAMLLDGFSQRAVAKKFGVAPSTIRDDYRIISAQWRADAQEDLATHKARELAKLNRMEHQMATAYMASLQPVPVPGQDPNPDPNSSHLAPTGPNGEVCVPPITPFTPTPKPGFKGQSQGRLYMERNLDAVKLRLGVLKRRHAILGLDAASKLEISGPNGGPLTIALVDAILDRAGLTATQPKLSPDLPSVVDDLASPVPPINVVEVNRITTDELDQELDLDPKD